MCSAFATWAKRHTNATLCGIQQNEKALLALGVPAQELLLQAYAESDGTLLSGSRAVTALFAESHMPIVRLVGRIMALPVLRVAAEGVYWLVARNRSVLSRWLGG
jgi:DCC1-like thiol-disulfide oxidoreductase